MMQRYRTGRRSLWQAMLPHQLNLHSQLRVGLYQDTVVGKKHYRQLSPRLAYIVVLQPLLKQSLLKQYLLKQPLSRNKCRLSPELLINQEEQENLLLQLLLV
jgi:hypothetical protein